MTSPFFLCPGLSDGIKDHGLCPVPLKAVRSAGDNAAILTRSVSRQVPRSSSPAREDYRFLLWQNGQKTKLYKRLAINESGIFFLAIGEQRGLLRSQRSIDPLQKRLALAERRSARLFSRGHWFSRIDDGFEVERKFTFDGPQNIWRLAVELYRSIGRDQLAPFIPEFDDEFQVWDYESLLFGLSQNGRSRGYIAFILQADARVTVKIKYFDADAETRREILEPDSDIPANNYREFARRKTGMEPTYICTFRRTRFDVNIESLETGNIFSVLCDTCRSLDSRAPILGQCEVEYVRSRSLKRTNYRREFEMLCEYVRQFLARRGVKAAQDGKSKLTHFLKAH